MPNKFFKLFTKEMRFSWRILVLSALVAANIYSWNKLSTSRADLKKLEHELMLVSSISTMEKELDIIESSQLITRSNIPANLPAISGILIQDNSPIALVGDDFLREGDSVGQYVISKITEHKITLKDKTTNLDQDINF